MACPGRNEKNERDTSEISGLRMDGLMKKVEKCRDANKTGWIRLDGGESTYCPRPDDEDNKMEG